MKRDALLASTRDLFEQRFAAEPAAVVAAPGRVNLLGEHTDYNGGFVLPMPLDLNVAIAIAQTEMTGKAELYSANYDSAETISLDGSKKGDWTDFILGCFKLAQPKPDMTCGYQILIKSDLPIGAGISSSAALEVAMLRALAAIENQQVDPVALATLAQKVEREFVGMPCGIMDQFVSSVGTEEMALFLDTRSLDFELAPLFPEHSIIVLHSGATHQLTDGSYEERVQQCERACAALGVAQLRDLSTDDLDRIEAIGGIEAIRARHVVTENQRVLDGVAALKAHDAQRFGLLMSQSHASQRDDYAITVARTDEMVEAAIDAGALGARQTGGGFGGAIVALVSIAHQEKWLRTMAAAFLDSHCLAIT